jgi:metallophosphoesterase superfamily enzyme
MSHTLELGPGLVAHPSGALWLPRDSALLIANPQFGFVWTLRRRGGSGTPSSGDVEKRLRSLLREFTPEVVVFLGQFLHSRQPGREERAHLEGTLCKLGSPARLVVVAGAEDPRFDRTFPTAGIRTTPAWRGSGVVAVHANALIRARSRGTTTIIGHLHPALGFRDAEGASRRVPAFLMTSSVVALPAFSPVTVGRAIERRIPPTWRQWLGDGPVSVAITSGGSVRRLPDLS